MIAALAVAALFQYSFAAGKPATYDLNLAFDGYLPILGGTTAKVEAKIQMAVQGEAPDKDGSPQVSSDLTALKVTFDGEPMPFTVESVKQYFPKTTVSISPQGKVLKTNAPNIALPVRLPGLDVKRIPEISFLPVEFPADGVEVGKQFEYEKPFGDSKVTYKVTPTKVEGGVMELDIQMQQSYETLEDDAKNLTTKADEAVYKVTTQVTGSGKATFDSTAGRLKKMTLDANSKSVAKPIKGGESENRQLHTTLTVKGP